MNTLLIIYLCTVILSFVLYTRVLRLLDTNLEKMVLIGTFLMPVGNIIMILYITIGDVQMTKELTWRQFKSSYAPSTPIWYYFTVIAPISRIARLLIRH